MLFLDILLISLMVNDVLGGCNERSAFECDGKCHPIGRWCDNFTSECTDGRDENNCEVGRECLPSEFQCNDGGCIIGPLKCDGHNKCNDGSDETDCEDCDMNFRCENGKCINMISRCNGYDGCGDGSDEENCDECIPNKEYLCLNGSFVAYYAVCDGREGNCADGSDEIGCDNFPDPLRTCHPTGVQLVDAVDVAECPQSACTFLSVRHIIIELNSPAEVELMMKDSAGDVLDTINKARTTAGRVEFPDVDAYMIDINIIWSSEVPGTYVLSPLVSNHYDERCKIVACELN